MKDNEGAEREEDERRQRLRGRHCHSFGVPPSRDGQADLAGLTTAQATRAFLPTRRLP
jgi:hypothetical protein